MAPAFAISQSGHGDCKSSKNGCGAIIWNPTLVKPIKKKDSLTSYITKSLLNRILELLNVTCSRDRARNFFGANPVSMSPTDDLFATLKGIQPK